MRTRTLAVAWILASLGMHPLISAYAPERAGFSVRFKGEECPYRIFGAFVLPGENIKMEIQSRDRDVKYELTPTLGQVSVLGPRLFEWRAPREPGLYTLRVIQEAPRDSILLNVFVMIPFDRVTSGSLNGYRIGVYPTIPYKGLAIYKPPKGFVEVTEENLGTRISPHFTLGQFLCKQEGAFPKYVVLRERLLLKLELILEKTNEAGFACETFHVLSGYRTPFYNKAIGNVKYSRHIYGGAADIFIDENPKDDMMDDLNGDGRIDYKDAEVLYDIVDGMYGKPWYEKLLGGLGWYRRNKSHGPFVHVDVRGFRARWGD